jgi:hypothetical protein
MRAEFDHLGKHATFTFSSVLVYSLVRHYPELRRLRSYCQINIAFQKLK